ncbi:hypothetical protein EJ05DRAFT_479659 [Pseudovirgaria hyperparasitica]|uniref:Uncharacterized protein n=1 Tax=Pseudovirgaria hyperparasitica TaxID=470096 RepID=A0A6A6VWU0_9PEZI|nr:uncharacterized protein EJ05DRAFT_479659 [Pseudovirgaria hyperparasitica]KAF2754110.1 hypothetical protein EJ05DRAFT_479659 [Pseudovirgaria hyperparasitica]
MRHEYSPVEPTDEFGSDIADDDDEFRNSSSLRSVVTKHGLRGGYRGGSLGLEVSRMALATIAFVSTKYILIDLYFHYPLHLLFAQLISLLLLSATLDLAASQTTSDKLAWLAQSISASQMVLEPSKASVVACVALALSLPFLAQAILHFPNLPTVSMLIIFEFTLEFACGQAISDPACRLGLKRVMIPLLLLLIGCSWLLLDEYRMESNGLLFALPAWGLFGLYRAIIETYTLVKISPQSQRFINHTLRTTILMSLGMTTLLLLMLERPLQVFSDLNLVHPITLAINLGSTASSLLLFFSNVDGFNQEKVASGIPSATWTLRGLCWAGTCAVASTLLTRPAMSTKLQVASLLAPSLSVVVSQLLWGREVSEQRRGQRLRQRGRDSRQSGDRDIGLVDIPQIERSPSRDKRDPPSTSPSKQQTSLQQVSALTSAMGRDCMALLALSLCIWTLFAVFVSPRAKTISEDQKLFVAHLDRAYIPKFDFDIVVSAYDEPAAFAKDIATRISSLSSFADQKIRLWVYTKDDKANVEELTERTGASHVVKRPNIGREGETYLYHIDREWDNLARHTLFVQAHVHNAWEFYRRIDQYYNQTTGMLSLGFVGHICECYNCHDRWGFDDDTGTILPDIHEEVMKETCRTPLLSYKGQFIASARRLRGTDRKTFQKLHKLIADPESEVHKPGYLKGRPDSMNAPFFGYTLERLWSILLQCSEYRIALRCPSTLSGTRRGGSLADCQCLDDSV